jgi:hypothetical protein
MALTALECPDNVCHSHHGGHAVAREEVERNLNAHGADWCERVAERIYEISVDSFCQTVMPNLHQQGWQRRHLDWEFKLSEEPAEVERTVVDGAINAMESFLRSNRDRREDLLDRMAEWLLEDAAGDFERARHCASADLNEVEHLLMNHAEAQH